MKKFITSAFMIIVLSGNAQNVGIGTSSPQTAFHIAKGSFLISSDTGSTPINGAGIRMMWIPGKQAFRAGQVTSSQWDNTNIGQYSAAFGYNVNATNQYSYSIGNSSTASGIASFAAGTGAIASGDYSVALGQNVTAQAYNSFSIGRYPLNSGSSNSWVATDPLFSIGNGEIQNIGGIGTIVKSNAFSVAKNGNTSISGNTSIVGDVFIGGSGGTASLNVARGTGTDGTTAFTGTTNTSYFNYSTAEDTHIRGGKLGSDVYINDITDGDIHLGRNTNNNVIVNAGLVLAPTNISVNANNKNITVGKNSYFIVTVTDNSSPTVTLSDGLNIGQVVIIHHLYNFNTTQTFNIQSWTVGDPNHNTILTSSSHTFYTGGTLTIIWDGTKWVEQSWSNIY